MWSIPRLIAKSYLAWWLGTPAWSPDGSRIAYTVYLEGGPDGLTYEIWTVSPDGTNPRRLLDLGECRASCAGGLAWSPDGSRIAFSEQQPFINSASDTSKSGEVFTMAADGSNVKLVLESHVVVSTAWPPAGWAWNPVVGT